LNCFHSRSKAFITPASVSSRAAQMLSTPRASDMAGSLLNPGNIFFESSESTLDRKALTSPVSYSGCSLSPSTPRSAGRASKYVAFVWQCEWPLFSCRSRPWEYRNRQCPEGRGRSEFVLEVVYQRPPHSRGLRVAVQKNEGRALSRGEVVKLLPL